ncbi:Palmitoyltransferase ZDHHC15 [Frankliniella fusca]|uniref:Palmitoyltransferase ZDHHC15 n=1 Tax=Frankliniella fusca TaxID=407009 RepID=A0AAE1H2I4_9NEOP|nr:Palmitoyltransferase ZDHHC15 [Frankliniella fusca]
MLQHPVFDGVHKLMCSVQSFTLLKSKILGDGVTFPQRCIDEDTDSLLGGCQRWDDPEAGCQQWMDPESNPRNEIHQEDSDSSSAVPDIVVLN